MKADSKKKETLFDLVKNNTVILVDKKEIGELRKKTEAAQNELSNYKNRLSKHDDLVYECNCENPLPSCSYIHSVDPDRSPRRPNFCPLDGNGCKWKKVKAKEIGEIK